VYLYITDSICVESSYMCAIMCRSELDHVCSADMSTEEFSVTLDVIVSPKDRPNAAASCPWYGYSGKGVSPKLLFMKKEELLAVTAEFGEFKLLSHIESNDICNKVSFCDRSD